MNQNKNRKEVALGIDLGTTTSCMAAKMPDQNIAIIENKDGERTTPSVVCFDKDTGAPIVGSNAILAAASAPLNFVYEAKRMLGQGYYSKLIASAHKKWTFKTKEIKSSGSVADDKATDNIGIAIKVGDKEVIYEPVQISAFVLSYLYDSAVAKLNEFPNRIAITVPAYFSEGAKQRTIDAARIAFSTKVDHENNKIDPEVVLLQEPTAAAVAYGSINMKNKNIPDGTEERILVFDLGGGTFDVSILEFCFDKKSPTGIVKATDGDNFLGGANFDNVIIDIAKEKFIEICKNMNANLPAESTLPQDELIKMNLRLRQEAIKVKNALSNNVKITFNLPCYRNAIDLVFDITRIQFEKRAKHLFDKLTEKCSGVLLSLEGITPIYTDDGRLNETATIQAKRDSGESINQPLTQIINEAKNSIQKVVMVGGSSRIPKVKSILEEFFNEGPETPLAQKKVVFPLNPDEAVAFGAGYFANAGVSDSYDSAEPQLLLIDQVPLNLNIETYGGVATKLIDARTAIPCKKSQIFSTAENNQTSVDIVITQGNRPRSADNYQIGRFTLSGISPAPRGTPQIEVTFDVDRNNVLHVTAIDKATNSKEIFVLNMTNKLSDADIENMIKVAETHAANDAIFAKRTNLKNQFETSIYAFEEKIDKLNVDATKKEELKSRLREEENWLKSLDSEVDPDVIGKRMQTFTTEIGALLQNPSAATGTTNNPNVEEVN